MTRLDAAVEQILDLGRRKVVAEAGDGQDAALLVEQAVLDLHRLQRNRRAGNEDRCHQADGQRHQQRACRGFFITGHGVLPSA
jgi:hypothetical protein